MSNTRSKIYLEVSKQEATVLLDNNSYFLPLVSKMLPSICCMYCLFLSRLQYKRVDKIANIPFTRMPSYTRALQ